MAFGENYNQFIEKFKPKKTTDDCYTPPEVYEVIKDYVCKRYEVDSSKVVRPFYPGGDYQNFNYENGAVVIDNPPFSILSQICEFYIENAIPFFLFAPALTLFSGSSVFDEINHIVCKCTIVYENGAKVNTSFLTNLDTDGTVVEVNSELTEIINKKVKELKKEKTKQPPKYDYPDYVITPATLQRLAARGVFFKVKKGDYKFIRALDSQREKRQGHLRRRLSVIRKSSSRKSKCTSLGAI